MNPSNRRAWIKANHPDVGGDHDAFVAGLAAFDERPATSSPRPAVRRSRRPHRVALRAVRTLRRRLAGLPPRTLK